MSKISKDEWDRHVMPRAPKLPTHGTQFDTRILDRMEVACGLFRYWERTDEEAGRSGFPADYRASQRAATRDRLRKTAQELLAALAPWQPPAVMTSEDGELVCPNEQCGVLTVPLESAVHRPADATFWCPSCNAQLVTP